MEEKKTCRIRIEGIDCADCAAKLERKIAALDGLEDVSLSFMNGVLVYTCEEERETEAAASVQALVAREEPDARVLPYDGHAHHHHEHGCGCGHDHACSCGHGHDHGHDHSHEHHHSHPVHAGPGLEVCRCRVEDIDCADCAAKLERKIASIDGVKDVSLSFVNSTLVYSCEKGYRAVLQRKIEELIAREEPDARVLPAHAERPQEKDESRLVLLRLAAGAVLFAVSLFISEGAGIWTAFAAYVILGYDVIWKAVRGIGRGQLFDEHFLMSVATFAAIYLGDMKEACGVMLFYQIGEFFQDMAVEKSRRSIAGLMDIRPEAAEVLRDGEWIMTDPEDVMPGELIRVKPSERVPLDGVVEKGASSLDTASLTGESRLRDVDCGDEVISGSINQTGVLEIRVTKEYGESTVARILELVENTGSRKAKAENFITSFSRIYTPAVVFSAAVVAAVVGLFGPGWHEGIYRACTFLVISCPCALVISVPLSFFAGIGGLSGRGILVKGANLIESLAKVKHVVMDKTGTLTSGRFAVEEIIAEDRDAVLRDAAFAESYSCHPVALGIREAYGKEIDASAVEDLQEVPGRGLSCRIGGETVLAGNEKLMADHGIAVPPVTSAGTYVHVARGGVYEGCLVLRDQLKEDAVEAVRLLQKEGCTVTVLSGDSREITEETGRRTGADRVIGECLPQDKVARVEEIRRSGVTAFVGDGVNDAPVLTAADTGIAMGALGSDAAIEAADVVIMDDSPAKVSLAIRAAARILRIARQNIGFAIIIKIAVLILGALGYANMWMAIFADTGVAMLCVLNSLRLLQAPRS